MKKKNIVIGTIVGLITIGMLGAGIYYYETHKIMQTENSVTVEAGNKLNLRTSDYFDAQSDILSKMVIDDSKVNTNTVGTFIATVSYKNKNFKISVNVEDTTKPVISAKDKYDVPMNENITVESLGITANDISEVTVAMKDSDAVNYNKMGEYTVTIVATDKSGNTASKDIKLCTIDSNPPTIDGVTDLSTTQGTTLSLLSNVTATDIEDGDITDKITVSDVDFSVIGPHRILYTVSDSYGNQTVQTCIVTVTEKPKKVVNNNTSSDSSNATTSSDNSQEDNSDSSAADEDYGDSLTKGDIAHGYTLTDEEVAESAERNHFSSN